MDDAACRLLGGLRPPSLASGRPTRVLQVGGNGGDAAAAGHMFRQYFGQASEYISIQSGTGPLPRQWLQGLAHADIITSDASAWSLREFDRIFPLLHPDGGVYVLSDGSASAYAAAGRDQSITIGDTLVHMDINATATRLRLRRFGARLARHVQVIDSNCGTLLMPNLCLQAFSVHLLASIVLVVRFDRRMKEAPEDVMFGVADPTMPFYSYIVPFLDTAPDWMVKRWALHHERLLEQAPLVHAKTALNGEHGEEEISSWPCSCGPNPLHQWAEAYLGPMLWKVDGYFDVYHHALCDLRARLQRSQRTVRILELGVNTGGGIHMWRHYFGPHVEYHGVDINPQCKRFEDASAGIHIHIGEQTDVEFISGLVKSIGGAGSIDFVSDDASHAATNTMSSFSQLWPALNRDAGLYMIEDLSSQPEVVEFFTSLETRSMGMKAHMVQHFRGVLVVSHAPEGLV